MGLRCLVVNVSGHEDLVFLLNQEEEALIVNALHERGGDSRLVLSTPLAPPSAPALMEQDLLEVRKLLLKCSAFAVTSAPDLPQAHRIAELVCDAHLQGVRVISLEEALLELDPSVPADSGELIHRLASCGTPQSVGIRLYRAIKHACEPVLAALLLLALSPLVLLVALAVRLTSPGPIFYRQTRLGYHRQLFDIIKFRSMRIDLEKDARLTPIGGLLRVTHLDKIPQIWNVVRGEVSFVGPRPERPIFCQELEAKIPLFRLRTLVKPGITGWAQVRAGYATTADDFRRKLEFDLYYILKHSPALDAQVVLETIAVLFNGGYEARKRQRALAGAPGVPGLARRPLVVVPNAAVSARGHDTSAIS